MDSATVLARMVEHDVPAGPVLTAEQVLEDAQVTHNRTLIEWQHPQAGWIRQPRPAAHFAATPAAAVEMCPAKGEHTDAVLRESGMSAADISRLKNAGVIG